MEGRGATMSYEPTDDEIGPLANDVMEVCVYLTREDALAIARYVLRNYELRSDEQRCDGSGRLLFGSDREQWDYCPGCSRCQPARCRNNGGLASGSCKDASESTTEQRAATAPPVAPVELCPGCATPEWCRSTGSRVYCGTPDAPGDCTVVDSIVYVDPDNGLMRMKPVVTEVRLVEDQFRVLVAATIMRDGYDSWVDALTDADALIAAAKEKW